MAQYQAGSEPNAAGVRLDDLRFGALEDVLPRSEPGPDLSGLHLDV